MIIAMPSAPKSKAFQTFQRSFVAHIRSPRKTKRPPGVDARRMGVYNELLFNNIEDVLSGCFPVLKQVMGRKCWTALARDFFAVHRCTRPFFRQVPDEFIDYLRNERKLKPADPPFLNDLAHYEWIELDLFVSDPQAPVGIDKKGDLFKSRPALNPALHRVSYAYEVHRISPAFQPKKPAREPFHYLVFRDKDDEIQFIVINAVTARLIDLLQRTKLTGEKALKKIAAELGVISPEEVLKGGKEILEGLRKKGAILGTWKKT